MQTSVSRERERRTEALCAIRDEDDEKEDDAENPDTHD